MNYMRMLRFFGYLSGRCSNRDNWREFRWSTNYQRIMRFVRIYRNLNSWSYLMSISENPDNYSQSKVIMDELSFCYRFDLFYLWIVNCRRWERSTINGERTSSENHLESLIRFDSIAFSNWMREKNMTLDVFPNPSRDTFFWKIILTPSVWRKNKKGFLRISASEYFECGVYAIPVWFSDIHENDTW